ncbi:MAG TPA: HEAT repeat domain-containing protein [Planctomycetota bacterium]|nr:HEAT repeat domain-containing protein [Planctomycetota bacterium]
MFNRSLFLILICSACAFSFAGDMVNVDELPHKTHQLPDGTKYTVITYGERNWRKVAPSVLEGLEATDRDICFEAKFDSVVPPDKLKLFGQQGTLIVSDRAEFKRLQTELRRTDNIWFAGELRKSKDGKSVELVLLHTLKQPKDLEKFELKIAALIKKGDFDGLIETGYLIEQQRTQGGNLEGGIKWFDDMGTLKTKAFETGLNLKEKSLKRDDADGLFAVALQWKEIMRRYAKFRELVERVLKIDPGHPRAQKFAEELGLEKFEGVWLRKDEVARLKLQQKQNQDRLNEEQKNELERKRKALEEAVAQRPQLLSRYQASLRVSDPTARQAAIASFGEAIGKSPDAGFGLEAAEVLVNLSDPAAVSPGLEKAIKSEHADVRRVVYEGLIWRGAQEQSAAFDLLAAALRTEKDSNAAHSAVDSLVSMGGKPAAATLIACLAADDKIVREEVIDGLKQVTKQSLNSKEAWQDWWAKNKDTFNPQ